LAGQSAVGHRDRRAPGPRRHRDGALRRRRLPARHRDPRGREARREARAPFRHVARVFLRPHHGTDAVKLFEREAPFGYALVLPAVVYLSLFIAYPFIMSIYMSLTDAQAGDARWRYVGMANYSKVDSYEVRADDFVLATFPTEEQAQKMVAAK